jgi:voltage-gated potassium channel
MEKLRRAIEESDTAAGRSFDLTIQALIVLSLVTFSIDTLPELPSTARSILRVIEIATVGTFTIEYLLRVLVARRRLRFIFSFFGLVEQGS